MKQSLQLKLGQQLTMTPQLQQAIKLLQLSTLDLQQEIQQALDSNPLLELAEDDYDAEAEARALATENSQSTGEATPEQAERDVAASADEWQTDTLPDELPVDTQWDDLLPSSSAPASQGEDAFDGDFDARNNARDSLQDQLLWQLNLTRLSDTDRIIAMAIIDATDANGRLQSSVEDIHESLTPDLDIDLDEVVAVLHCLQQFEPAGVCTRDLQECLLVQLQQLPPGTPCVEQARLMISRHMAQLGSGDYKQIMRRMRLSEAQLKEVLDLIRTLDPNPGQSVGEDTTEYVVSRCLREQAQRPLGG